MGDDLTVNREGDTLVIRIPIQKATPSASGKTLVVASTRGNQKTAVQIDGKDLYLGVMPTCTRSRRAAVDWVRRKAEPRSVPEQRAILEPQLVESMHAFLTQLATCADVSASRLNGGGPSTSMNPVRFPASRRRSMSSGVPSGGAVRLGAGSPASR